MKKLVLLLLLVCTCATLSWAQSGKRITVTGSVIDGDDKSPVGQATVQLLSLPDSTMVVENVTNNNGVFSIAGPFCIFSAVSLLQEHCHCPLLPLRHQDRSLPSAHINPILCVP